MYGSYGYFQAQPGVHFSGPFVPAEPGVHFSGPETGNAVYPQQVLPNAYVENNNWFDTGQGNFSEGIEVPAVPQGASVLPQYATTAPPGTVPIAIEAGPSGVIQDVQGGGGEEGAIYAFLPPQARGYVQQAGSILTRQTVVPFLGPVENWKLAAAVAIALFAFGGRR
jgi:hypothetical protein